MVNSLLRSLTGSLTILLFWIYFFLLILVFVLQWLSFHWGIQIMLLSQFPFTFCQTQNEMPISFCSLVIVLVIVLLIGMVFVIIGEMFHGRISLKSVPLVNFVSGLRLELINISLIIISGQASLHGFRLLVLLPYFIEITFFLFFSNRINFLNLNSSSDRIVNLVKGFLKLPNVHMLIKQNSPSLPRNFALGTFGKLLIYFSTKVNMLYLD